MFGLVDAWVLLLLFTELTVFAGCLWGVRNSVGRNGRVVNSLLIAFACALISLTASLSADAQYGANLVGIGLLLVSYGLMGVLGGLTSAWWASRG